MSTPNLAKAGDISSPKAALPSVPEDNSLFSKISSEVSTRVEEVKDFFKEKAAAAKRMKRLEDSGMKGLLLLSSVALFKSLKMEGELWGNFKENFRGKLEKCMDPSLFCSLLDPYSHSYYPSLFNLSAVTFYSPSMDKNLSDPLPLDYFMLSADVHRAASNIVAQQRGKKLIRWVQQLPKEFKTTLPKIRPYAGALITGLRIFLY